MHQNHQGETDDVDKKWRQGKLSVTQSFYKKTNIENRLHLFCRWNHGSVSTAWMEDAEHKLL